MQKDVKTKLHNNELVKIVTKSVATVRQKKEKLLWWIETIFKFIVSNMLCDSILSPIFLTQDFLTFDYKNDRLKRIVENYDFLYNI